MIINYNAGKMDLDGTAPKLSVTFHAPQYELIFNVQKIAVSGRMQRKEIVPTEQTQTIYADSGFTGLSEVVIAPIPQNYGRITYETGGILSIE